MLLTCYAILPNTELCTEYRLNKHESQLLLWLLTPLHHIKWGYVEKWILTLQNAQYLGHGCKSPPSKMQACFSRSSGHSFPPPIAMCFTLRILLRNPGERLPERHVLEQGLQEDHSVVSQSFGMMQDCTVKGKESFMQRLKGHKQKPVGHRLNRCNQHYEVPIIFLKIKSSLSVQIWGFKKS